MHRKILYSLFSILYSLFSILYSLFSILYSLFSLLPTGGNPKPIDGERKVQLIMFTYLRIKGLMSFLIDTNIRGKVMSFLIDMILIYAVK